MILKKFYRDISMKIKTLLQKFNVQNAKLHNRCIYASKSTNQFNSSLKTHNYSSNNNKNVFNRTNNTVTFFKICILSNDNSALISSVQNKIETSRLLEISATNDSD